MLLPRGNVAKRAEEAPDALVVLRHTAAVNARKVGAAKDGQDADIGSEDRLQKEHLKFDRVFHRMAIVFHPDGVVGRGGQFIHQCGIRARFAVGCEVGLSGEAEFIGSAVVRGAEDHESAVAELRAQVRVGGAVGFITALRADMRGGDADEFLAGRTSVSGIQQRIASVSSCGSSG